MRDGDFLESGRRSTDTVQYLRKIEKEFAKAGMDATTWKLSYRDEAMKSANLQHQLNAAKKLIALLIEPADPKQFYEIKRGQKMSNGEIAKNAAMDRAGELPLERRAAERRAAPVAAALPASNEFEELRKLAMAATPGPWHIVYGDDRSYMCMTAVTADPKRARNEGPFGDHEPLVAVTYHQAYPVVDTDAEDDCGDANSAFIAAANPATVMRLIELAATPALPAAPVQQPGDVRDLPEGFVVAPHYRGYAQLGTGQYLLNHSAAGEAAEFIISVATDGEKAGRVVGDERSNAPDKVLLPEAMAVRIAFANVAGLDAMENQLRKLRAEHFPDQALATTQPAVTDERAAFEAWSVKWKYNLKPAREESMDTYMEGETETAWMGWEARAILAASGGVPAPAEQGMTELQKFQIVAGCATDDLGDIHDALGFPDDQPIDAEDMIEAIRELQAATGTVPAPALPAIPEGWKLVPVEPTDEMRMACPCHQHWAGIDADWAAMLAAAPATQGGA